jgi:hypothetical protein
MGDKAADTMCRLVSVGVQPSQIPKKAQKDSVRHDEYWRSNMSLSSSRCMLRYVCEKMPIRSYMNYSLGKYVCTQPGAVPTTVSRR